MTNSIATAAAGHRAHGLDTRAEQRGRQQREETRVPGGS